MTQVRYYKAGNYFRKIENNKVYWYDYETKVWEMHQYVTLEIFLNSNEITSLTSLNILMMEIPE